MMEGRKRRRKLCDTCGEEFSDRHYRRHKYAACSCVQDLGETKHAPSKSDHDMYGSSNDTLTETDTNTGYQDRAQCSMYENTADSYVSSTDEDICSEDIDLEDVFPDITESESYTQTGTSEIKNAVQRGYVLWILKGLELWQSRYSLPGAALAFILLLIKSILFLCSRSSSLLKDIYNDFPATMYQMHAYLSHKKDTYRKYVVCTKCYSLYTNEKCFEVVEGRQTSKRCFNVPFPDHPVGHLRGACGNILLNEVKMQSYTKLLPFKTYCYNSLVSSLATLVKRCEFENKCEMWRERQTQVPGDVLTDVYDGNIWKEFTSDKFDFLCHPRNYALMLNVDWFQPFKRTTYSVGGIYLVILNLPREERFKKENMILVGLIPDMKSEPPTNSFIGPLVEELKQAWDGFYMKSSNSPDVPVRFRLALLCVGCDIPASRKLCGFLGHSATMGCNKCLKAFLGGFGVKNYGGFNDTWTCRSNESHRDQVQKVTKAKTKTSKEEAEREYGVRYSVLLELPYFDPVRMTVIDPMHNLFLGTSKRMLSVWKAASVITEDQLNSVQTKIEAVQCPSDVGKLPLKFSSCYNSFTADQWKNWTLMFSVFALKDILPQEDLECWRKFVLACKLLTTRIVRKSSIHVADKLLLAFCMQFEELYGQEKVTPNRHLHLHLKDCIADFGPVYSFWLFSFERENGILESIPTNKHNIEIQLMRRCLEQFHGMNITCNFDILDHFGSGFKELLQLTDEQSRGSLGQMSSRQNFELSRMSSRNFNFQNADWSISAVVYASDILYRVSVNLSLSDDELRHLTHMYSVLYPNSPSEMLVCNSGKLVKQVSICGNKLGTKDSRSCRSSMILAHWCGNDGMVSGYDSVDLTPRPGQIDKFILHTVFLNNEPYMHLIAKVNWFMRESETMSTRYGKPIEVWKGNVYEAAGSAMFMPVQRIKSKFVYAYEVINNKNVLVVMPRDRYLM